MENSPFGRLIGVLVAPHKTFRSIAERPTWLVAFLVLVLAPLLPGIVAKPKIDWEEVARHQIERSGVDVPREQMEQQIEITAKIGPFFIYAAPFFMAVGLLLFALVFWGAFTLAGGEPGFQRSLAVTTHAMLPMVVAALLSVPVILGNEHHSAEVLEQGGYLKSSLAAFAPGDGIILVTLLQDRRLHHLEPGAAGHRLNYAAKVKAKTAAIVVGLLWLVWVVVSVGLASLGALMGGKRG